MREKVRQHNGLARLAGGQHGVVGDQQLLELGYSGAAIGRAIASRRLNRIHRGAYAVGNPQPSRTGSLSGRRLGLWRGSDAEPRLRGVALGPALGMPGATRGDASGSAATEGPASICIHQSTILEAVDRTIREGVPTTSVRAHLARLRRDEHAAKRSVGLSSERSAWTLWTSRDRRACLAAADVIQAGQRLRSSIDLYRDPVFTRAGTERRFLELVRKAGLPRPAINTFVGGHELDAYWAT